MVKAKKEEKDIDESEEKMEMEGNYRNSGDHEHRVVRNAGLE